MLTSALDAALSGEAAVRHSNEIRGIISNSINKIKSKNDKNKNLVINNKFKESDKKNLPIDVVIHMLFGELKKKFGNIQ